MTSVLYRNIDPGRNTRSAANGATTEIGFIPTWCVHSARPTNLGIKTLTPERKQVILTRGEVNILPLVFNHVLGQAFQANRFIH